MEWGSGKAEPGSVFPFIEGGAALGNQENTGRSVWAVSSGDTQRRDDPQLSSGWPTSLVFIFVSFSEPGSQHVAQGRL